MSATVETPPAPTAVAEASAPPVSEAKPLAQVAPKVPVYRRLDMRCVVNVKQLDPGSVPAPDMPARIEKLGQNVFVESRDTFAPGVFVRFVIKAPQRAEAYRADGVVRWISDDPRGVGVQLVEVALAKPGDEIPAPPKAPAPSAADSKSAAAPATSASAASKFSLPEPAGVAELLSGLLGKTIEAKPAGTWAPTPDAPAMVAAFGPDDGPTSCLWVFDFHACIYAGGALTMVPGEETKQAVEAKELRDGFIENVREVFNVGSSLFNGADGASVKLKDTYVTSGEMPESVKQLLSSSGKRLDIEITVPDYGKGNVSVIVS